MRSPSRVALVALLTTAGCRVEPADSDTVPGLADLSDADTLLSTLNADGEPVIFSPDDSVRRVLSVGESALFPASLSPRGDRAAICTAAPGESAGSPRDTVLEGELAMGLGKLDVARALCGDTIYGPNGDLVAWGEQDEDGMMRLRVTPVGDGLRPAGDDKVRARGLFAPNFVLGGSAVAAITSTSTDVGPIGLADLGTGETWTLTSTEAQSELVASPDGRRLVTPHGYSLILIDVAKDSATTIWSSLDESDGCSVSDVDRDPECFLAVTRPSFSPDSSRVVFMARPQFGDYTPDLRVVDVYGGSETVFTDRSHYRDSPVFGSDGLVYWVDDFTAIGRAAPKAGAGDDAELLPFGSASGLRVAWPKREE